MSTGRIVTADNWDNEITTPGFHMGVAYLLMSSRPLLKVLITSSRCLADPRKTPAAKYPHCKLHGLGVETLTF